MSKVKPTVFWSDKESQAGAWVATWPTYAGYRRVVLKGIQPNERAKAVREANRIRKGGTY